MIDQDREGAEPARIDKSRVLGRPSAAFEGKPVGARATRASACGFGAICALRETLGS